MDRDRKNLEDFQSKALELLTLEKGVREAGMVRIYESLDDTVLKERMKAAKNRVYMLVFWLKKPEERFGEILEMLCKANVSIKVLQVKPESGVARIRAESQRSLFPDEEAFDATFIARIVEKNNHYFQTLKEKTGGRIEAKTFSSLPPFSLVLIDDSAFIRFYGYGQRVSNTPHLEIRFGDNSDGFNYFSTFILSQFDMLWDSAEIAI
jgi:hypothetical protein